MKDDNANYDYSSVPMAGLPMIGALMGMCLGGPVGILAGVKIGGLAAVGGSILGYTGASVVSEQKELREYIDEHYEQQPELYVQTPMEEALAKRRSSRSLPELPGPGESRRALASAKYRQVILTKYLTNIYQISAGTQRVPSTKSGSSHLIGDSASRQSSPTPQLETLRVPARPASRFVRRLSGESWRRGSGRRWGGHREKASLPSLLLAILLLR